MIPTSKSTGPDTRDEPEPSGSGRTSGEGAETTKAFSRAARVTRSAAKLTLGTSYSLKWENGLIMTVQASQLKSHGVDSVCTYKKSKHYKEGKKSHLSRAHNLQKSL